VVLGIEPQYVLSLELNNFKLNSFNINNTPTHTPQGTVAGKKEIAAFYEWSFVHSV